MVMKKENKKIRRETIIIGNNKKLIDIVENEMMGSVKVCSSPEDLYKVFKKYAGSKQEVSFEIIGGTNKNPYFFEINGKPSACSMNHLKNLYQIFHYYLINKWANEHIK